MKKRQENYLILIIVAIVICLNIAFPEQSNNKQNAYVKKLPPEAAKIANLKANIKDISEDITDVEINKYSEGYKIIVKYNNEPAGYGALDWANIIGMFFNISKKTFQYKENTALQMLVYSPMNDNDKYGNISITRKNLPEKWQDLNDFDFFAYTTPIAIGKQPQEWLCNYYKEFESARPNGNIPEECKAYLIRKALGIE